MRPARRPDLHQPARLRRSPGHCQAARLRRAPGQWPRRPGFALADFLAGTLIFAAVLTAFAGLTRSKFVVLGAAEERARALASAEAEVDRIRLHGLLRAPEGDADAQGFRRTGAFAPDARLAEAEGAVEVRSLRMEEGGDPRGLWEVRVRVSWRSESGPASLALSTLAELPAGRGAELPPGGGGRR